MDISLKNEEMNNSGVDENISKGDDEYTISQQPQDENSIRKIYPSRTELSVINNCITCTEAQCTEVFTSYSNLNLHLFKTHKKKDAIQSDSVVKHYHCPETHCIYHQSQWFSTKKLLKQHFLKVHSPKTFVCEHCNEGFATKAFKNMHTDYCSVRFKCNDCPLSYPKYESLLTHARRKGHSINEKTFFKLKKAKNTMFISCSKSDSQLLNRLKPILPKPISSLGSITNLALYKKKSDQAIQTEHTLPKLKSRITQINRNFSLVNRDTRQTQTGLLKDQSSIETQTIGDYFRGIEKDDSEEKKYITAQSSTQTNLVSSKSVSSNTFFPVDDSNISESNIITSSSGTQTLTKPCNNSFSTTTNTHDSIDTDTSDLMENNLESFEAQYFNCNMETQTDCIFNEDLFVYGDYYSNMYTQTCEDLLLNTLELNHIETQTVDDMLKSVEIQTSMLQKKTQNNCRDISHMETQTDTDFKQILEVING